MLRRSATDGVEESSGLSHLQVVQPEIPSEHTHKTINEGLDHAREDINAGPHSFHFECSSLLCDVCMERNIRRNLHQARQNFYAWNPEITDIFVVIKGRDSNGEMSPSNQIVKDFNQYWQQLGLEEAQKTFSQQH